MFLYIDPLKQGLKLSRVNSGTLPSYLFLYIDPLKQGLKHIIKFSYYSKRYSRFLYIDPLKQGLKPSSSLS